MKKCRILAAVLALLLCWGCAAAQAQDNWLESVLGGMASSMEIQGAGAQKAAGGYLAELYIEGELLEGDSYYDHPGTLNAIKSLVSDERNAALLLVFNTPGGGLYESDELYHEIMVYKQLTGRPVYAYMKQECCSGGVYAAMAADTIFASKMTITGSVGVYVQTFSEAGLLEKLGIEQEFITTGDNKVAGYPTLTESQRAIEQAMVDEGFEFFKEVISTGRGLSEEQMASFLDGRILTALQAREAGLIDEVLYYDDALSRIFTEQPQLTDIRDITPEWEMGLEDMITQSILDLFMP